MRKYYRCLRAWPPCRNWTHLGSSAHCQTQALWAGFCMGWKTWVHAKHLHFPCAVPTKVVEQPLRLLPLLCQCALGNFVVPAESLMGWAAASQRCRMAAAEVPRWSLEGEARCSGGSHGGEADKPVLWKWGKQQWGDLVQAETPSTSPISCSIVPLE